MFALNIPYIFDLSLYFYAYYFLPLLNQKINETPISHGSSIFIRYFLWFSTIFRVFPISQKPGATAKNWFLIRNKHWKYTCFYENIIYLNQFQNCWTENKIPAEDLLGNFIHKATLCRIYHKNS